MTDFYEVNYDNFIMISEKDKNDKTNKIREEMLKICFENYKNIGFNPKIGKNIFDELSILLEANNIDKITDVQHIGGMKANDFVIKYLHKNKEKILNIDFKFNVKNIKNLAQVKQIYTTNKKLQNFIKEESYHKFYYENYLDKILEYLATKNIILDKPEYSFYVSKVNNFDKKTMDKFFNVLKTNQKKYTKEYKKIVDTSISMYLDKYGKNNDIEILIDNLESTENKAYLLFKNNKFYLENMSSTKIKSFSKIKNNNTLVFDTNDNKKIEMMLRWKNGAGCIGSAWQIKIV